MLNGSRSPITRMRCRYKSEMSLAGLDCFLCHSHPFPRFRPWFISKIESWHRMAECDVILSVEIKSVIEVTQKLRNYLL